jgi:TolB protein
MKLVMIIAVGASCGFPRPADVLPEGGTADGGAVDCQNDADCKDATQPICLAGRCLSSSDACREGGGARVVFISNRDGNPEVYRAYANGAAPTRLTSYDPPQATTAVAPSPDGKSIAFIHDSDVFVMTVDGRNPVNITKSPALESQVEWSPDGKFLAVATADTTGIPGAYVMANDGSRPMTLMGPAGAASRDPSWWPDSSKMIFASTVTGSETDLWATPISPPGQGGASLIKVQMPGESFSGPRVAPSAVAITFLVTDAGGTTALIVPTFGGIAEPLTAPGINDHEVVWSHDSSKLAVVRGNGSDRTIFVVKADGSGLASLTAGGHPRWSLDDRYVLFDTARDGNREVYRMDNDGANQTDLTNAPYDDFGGEWLSCSN